MCNLIKLILRNNKKRILIDEVYGILNFLDEKKEADDYEKKVKR